MALTGSRTFVGFGFGPIQGGLFLHEAFRSGGFKRLVAAEVMPDTVRAVRGAGGRISVNVACADRIEVARIGPIEVYDPACPNDRMALTEAVAEAEAVATALPSVRQYASNDPSSVHRILAGGLLRKAAKGGPRCLIYAAENHNHAAEILEAKVLGEIPPAGQSKTVPEAQFLNTVIGKMSGVIADRAEIEEQGLTPLAPGLPRAFLVEEFNRILISRIRFEDFRPGITVFEEKDDLLPFEEAKLFGHNATHALAAYLGAVRKVRRIADLRAFPDIMKFLRAAFIEESGAALIRRHSGVDPLFTPEGYRAYAEDLLQRMVNPFLQDTVERVGRDRERKLGWDDRLVGTVRMALGQGISARRFAMGVAAALENESTPAAVLLDSCWANAPVDPAERQAVLDLVEQSRRDLRCWIASGYSTLDQDADKHGSTPMS